MRWRFAVCLGLCAIALAQQPPVAPGTYAPPGAEERGEWWGQSTYGPASWFAGAFGSGWSTIFNSPREWDRSAEGFGRRMATRTANVTVSNGLEAGLGAVWGEDPRYPRKGQGSLGSRVRHVLKLTVMARDRSGRARPAYARMLGTLGGNVLQDFWMPPSANGLGRISYNTGIGFSARAGSNAFREFWPDLRRLVFRK